MPSNESLQWKPLKANDVRGLLNQKILAVRADGKGYYGAVVGWTAEYLELKNGNQVQLLRFFDSPTQYAIVGAPPQKVPRLAESQLFGKDKNRG